jgi:hypothetical protein
VKQAAQPSRPVDPWQPVVTDMPEKCVTSEDLIDTDRTKPAWCTSQALPLHSERAQQALAQILGKRLRKVGSSVLDDDRWKPVTVTDSLDVALAPDGTVTIDVLINFVNDHTCTLTARLEVLDDGSFRIRDDGCQLRAEVRGHQLVFGDECPTRCATASYCGARGGFNGTSFELRGPLEASHGP